MKGRVRSFKYALQGLGHLFRRQPNAWIHLIAGVIVVLAGFALDISASEWIWIIVAIGSVFGAELMNSAIEETVDFISPERDERAGRIKDLSAGAVLVIALMAAVIGLIIFVPKVFIS
jgi:diacylglycerol kinase (ATP)